MKFDYAVAAAALGAASALQQTLTMRDFQYAYNRFMTSREHPKRARAAVLSADTSQDAERLQVDLWRRMSPEEKLRAVREMTCAVQELSLAGIRLRYGGAPEDECRLRLAMLTLGHDLACTVYPEASSLADD